MHKPSNEKRLRSFRFKMSASVSFGSGLSDKHQTPIWIFNVELGHPIFPVE